MLGKCTSACPFCGHFGGAFADWGAEQEVAVRDITKGLLLFARATSLLARRPRLFAIGVAPALITMVLFGAAFVVLLMRLGELSGWLTPFATDWAGPVRQGMRVLAGIAVLVAAGMVGVVTYTAVTLLIGGPFYEYLSQAVDDSAGSSVDGPVDGPAGASQRPGEPGGWRLFVRGLRDSVLLVAASLGFAGVLLAAGFVPVLGQTVIPAFAVTVGAWLLALELVGVPFTRRGLRLRDRHRALRHRRMLTLGTAVPAYLLCTIPFTAVLVMPVAVVAGTLLAREVLAEHGAAPPDRPR